MLQPEPAGRPLALYLAGLCAALLSPALALLGYLAVREFVADRDRQQMEAGAVATRIGITLDHGLTTLSATLDVLATSNYLAQGDFAAFRSRALAIHRSPRSSIALRDPAGSMLANTAESPAGPSGEPETEAERGAARTGQAQVSGLLASASGQPEFVVAVPVFDQQRRVTYVLSMTMPTDALGQVFRGEVLPRNTTATVLDAQGLVLASSADGERMTGKQFLPGTVLPDDAGWVRANDVVGTNVVAAVARSQASRWAVVASVPEADFSAALWRSVGSGLAFATVLCLLAVALAFAFARRLTRTIAALEGEASPAAGSAGVLVTPIREINAVACALAAARVKAAVREQEREELLLTLDQAQVRVQDLDGRILVWTTGCERLYGWSRAEALGQISHVLLHSELPRPLPEIEAELREHNEWHGEIRNRRRDGAPVIVACQWALRRASGGEPLALVEACNDVTGLRQAEAALRRSRDLLASVMNGSPEPIFAKDLEGRYALLNPPAAAILGVAPEAALGRRTRELVGPKLAETVDAADEAVIASGEATVTEGEFIGRHGERRVLLATKAPWRDDKGHIVGLVGVSRDITPRREAEERLHQTQAALFHVERRSAMGAMAAALSHELNQPLTAATNFAEAAARLISQGQIGSEGRDEAREAIVAAGTQLVRAGTMLRGMRDFIGSGDGERSPVAVNDVIEQGVPLALMGARDQGISVRMQLVSPAPLVLADRVHIEQVIVNLVRNAAEALETEPRREIMVSTACKNGHVEIRVADSGSGLPAGVAARLFQPFVTTKRTGMGVGLSVSHSIVEQHGGTLSAAANLGGGTVFLVTLPALPRTEPVNEASYAG